MAGASARGLGMAFDPQEWLPIGRGHYDRLTGSESTQVVPPACWPPHVPKMEAKGNKVAQVWAWAPQEGQGAVEVIRETEHDGSTMWKRDRWYLMETTDGRTWISRVPDKNIEGGGHRSDTLPPWPLS